MDAYQDVYFKKLIIIAFLPILLLGGLTLGWVFIMLRHSKNDDYKPKFMGTLCVIFFLIHPSLTSYMFSIFSCMDLYGDEYLVKNLDIKCWDETHSFYAVAVALPAILIWSIGVPFFIFLYLVKNRHKLHQVDFKLKLGFLYTGYKTKVFYWEFVIMARKISIIILWVFLNSSSRSFQALACFTVLLVYLQMHYGKGPFERPDLNETEFRGLLVSTSTIYCGLYYLTDGLANGSKIFFFVLMIFSNLYFLLY